MFFRRSPLERDVEFSHVWHRDSFGRGDVRYRKHYTVSQDTETTPAIEVRTFGRAFLSNLAAADWNEFKRFWAEDATMFAPGRTEPVRIEGLVALQQKWQRQFASMRKDAARRGVTSPPFVNVDAREMRIDLPAPGVAVLGFCLEGGGTIRRGTLVAFKRQSE